MPVPTPKCEACEENEAIAVCSVPAVAMSCAYCARCLREGIQPYHILVANTACLGGWDQAAEWWKTMVRTTLKFKNKTEAEFLADVAKSLEDLP